MLCRRIRTVWKINPITCRIVIFVPGRCEGQRSRTGRRTCSSAIQLASHRHQRLSRTHELSMDEIFAFCDPEESSHCLDNITCTSMDVRCQAADQTIPSNRRSQRGLLIWVPKRSIGRFFLDSDSKCHKTPNKGVASRLDKAGNHIRRR